jgi:ubiquinone biosynthesis protein UbiJ
LNEVLSEKQQLLVERDNFIEFIDDIKNQQMQLEELVTKVRPLNKELKFLLYILLFKYFS